MPASPLDVFDLAAWAEARAAILRSCHVVDRDALVVWSHFHPLRLAEAFAATTDHQTLRRELRLQGQHDLVQLRDASHHFFYGHRFWPQVRQVVREWTETMGAPPHDLPDLTRGLAEEVAARAASGTELTAAITFVGLSTLRQIGTDAFTAGAVSADGGPLLGGTADEIVERRRQDDRQGMFGFLRGPNTRFSITFDERRRDGCFPLVNQQHLTTAAALDGRDYTTTTGIRSSHEGPIPCDCRSASCGTCWVGILGGRDKLSDVEPLEERRLIEFGYWPVPEPKPLIRLACMARASGNVTLVIPTWHGRIGRLIT